MIAELLVCVTKELKIRGKHRRVKGMFDKNCVGWQITGWRIAERLMMMGVE